MLTESAPEFEPDLLEQQRLASLELAAPRLAGYEIEELIGEGTYGNVWKARETQTGVTVAIKRLRRRPEEASCEEVKRLASLGAARGIIALREVHLDSEPYCYVMEYLDGGTLGDLTAEKGALPFADSWRIFRQLTEALCYVHKAEIIHCDLKPDNILLDSRGHVRIGDFGQARGQGPQGSSLGTRFYMPPEQARLDMPQPQWDVYALGAILYELLTGSKPRYDAQLASLLSTRSSTGSEIRDRLETYARHLEKAPPPLAHRAVKKVDSSVASLIERCLALDLDQRPQDAAAVLKLIEQCEHARHSRPLLIFGGLAPAVMMLVLGLFTIVAGLFTLGWIERAWTENVIASNEAIAEAIERSTAARFAERMRTVQRAAQDPALYEVLQQRSTEGENAKSALENLYLLHNDYISRWSLTQPSGFMICNYGKLGFKDGKEQLGVDVGSNGQNFAWRGWFNGQEDGPKSLNKARDEDLQAFRQRRRRSAFIAQPYLRVGNRNFLVVTVSCPLAPSNEAEPIGVLAGSIYYDDFLKEVNEFVSSQEAHRREVVIVNNRRQVIYHHKLLDKARSQTADFAIEKCSDCEHFRQAFDGERQLPPYVDPLDGNHYLGACRVADLGNGQQFAIFVQQERHAALGTVWTLRWVVISLAAGLFGVGGVFLATNSYALYWTLRQQREGGGHA